MKKKIYYLRDPIHLDIAFERKFFELISTVEFQRLARIKQLSCEYLVFPTALHNRFSHSIGTYHVMGLLLEKITKIAKNYGIAISEEDNDLALCAALLHDIGHGPFSHTFERILNKDSHEEFTKKIIKDKETEINRALRENFGEDFIDKLLQIFDKNTDNVVYNIIIQLISSQLDADRMDYLLRDSYFTGVSNGNYDLYRLVNAIDIAEIDGEYKICVNEKYISSIEEYVMARFYMHKEVYQHPLKRQLENILQKIFIRARHLYKNGIDIFYDLDMKKIFDDSIDIGAYLRMDDNFLMYHISKWQYSNDEILSYLSKAFVNRKKFKKYREFDESLYEKLSKKLKELKVDDLEECMKYCYINDKISVPIYNKTKENIWLKSDDGKISDITEKSFILQNIDVSKKFIKVNEFYHEDMLYKVFGIRI